MKIKVLLLGFFLGSVSLLMSAPLKNIPVEVTQPDGTIISCYTSGDEFYHWLHDSVGNIIIQDSISSYYCYRIENTDSLVIVGENNDSRLNFEKNPYEFPNNFEENFRIYNQTEKHPYKFSPTRSESPRIINNLVVFITFADQSDFTQSNINAISNMFVDSTENANSMKQYYWESSYHQIKVNSTFYPSGGVVYSYKDTFSRSYYCEYSNTHPEGYNDDEERKDREHTLLKNAINSIKTQIPSTINIDTDNNNFVDNVCFIIKGGHEGPSDLLWPHHWVLLKDVSINGKKVSNYNLHLENYIIYSKGVGVLCHEFGHTLGMPDLYHYNKDTTCNTTWKPVDIWDIMANDPPLPQQMSGYMKWKYLGWINSIPEITSCGRYSLTPISSSSQCYKIPITGSNEYLYLEYRKKTHTYDQSIPNSGLLVYRINPTGQSNCNAVLGGGKDDEIYVYRPNGTFSSDGDLSLAPFCEELGTTTFNQTTNPQEFLSNGDLGNVYIYNVSECGSTISFDVRFRTLDDIVYNQNSTIPPVTNAETITTTGSVVINSNTTFKAATRIVLNGGFQVSSGISFVADVNPCE